jgi:hypothetical protein
MEFSTSPVGFANEVLAAINSIRLRLLGGSPPAALFHYTSLAGVIGITESRSLRAFCVANQKDISEIRYGAEIVDAEIKEMLRKGVGATTQMILEGLTRQAVSRMDRTFVACFCSSGISPFHWRRYGEYCLRFDTNESREPLLRPASMVAEAGYHRVIYGRIRQKSAIQLALRGIARAVSNNTHGTPSGPWVESIVKILTRDAAELILDLLIAFKKVKYWPEREWRLTVRPKSSLASSAPEMADHNFDLAVHRGERNYVDLQLPGATQFFEPIVRPGVPFSAVLHNPFLPNAKERALIQDTLEQNGRGNIPVKRLPFLWACGRWP